MRDKGFTLIEMVVVLTIISILIAIVVPMVARYINDARITRTKNELQVIGAAILSLNKDTGKWPFTNMDGPSGGVNRVIGGNPVLEPGGECKAVAPPEKALPGAINWGSWLPFKPLYDYLNFNNPDNNTGPLNVNEIGHDYPLLGEFRWNGPYIDRDVFKNAYKDAWGYFYVINARYFPGNNFFGQNTAGHRVLLLSAGPDNMWSTSFSDYITKDTLPDDNPYGDDLGFVLYTNETEIRYERLPYYYRYR